MRIGEFGHFLPAAGKKQRIRLREDNSNNFPISYPIWFKFETLFICGLDIRKYEIKVAFTHFGQRPYLGQYSVGKREGIGNNFTIYILILFKFQIVYL